jgi:hypothetical protein
MVRQEDWRRDHPATTNPTERDVTALGIVQVHLSGRDLSFANSLIEQFNARGSLSEKQLFWIKELTKRAQANAAPRAQATTSTPAPAPQPAVTFPQILALFAKAGSRAAIVFRTINSPVDHGSPIEFRLSVAGERSQQPGSINVTDAAQGFENRVWYGRIATSGEWQPSRKIPAAELTLVAAALTRFDADPAAAAADYGHTVGSCCFCRRELTDERSTTVGYGPICAAKFGLPWGEVTGPKPENKLTCDVPF